MLPTRRPANLTTTTAGAAPGLGTAPLLLVGDPQTGLPATGPYLREHLYPMAVRRIDKEAAQFIIARPDEVAANLRDAMQGPNTPADVLDQHVREAVEIYREVALDRLNRTDENVPTEGGNGGGGNGEGGGGGGPLAAGLTPESWLTIALAVGAAGTAAYTLLTD